MTDPKLREARIARAKELAGADAQDVSMNYQAYVVTVANHLIDLIEQDWRPEPEVDAVTLAAREWITSPANVDATYTDAFRAGHAHALANCADVRRMDWLEAAPKLRLKRMAHEMEYGITIDPLRTKIDRAMEQPS